MRIRSGFSLAAPQGKSPSRAAGWGGLQQANLDQLAERARPYLHHIVEEVERRDMPTEIALLPIVESAYRPEAYSPGHAAGIWQLIPSTGRRMGLKQTAWYDGRRDVLASTGAALDYLEELHRRFGGDWLHALAAYNCGEGAVEKAIDRNARAGRPTDYWALDLPTETKRFVPKLLAISSIVARPADYKVSLRPIPNRPYITEIEVGRQIDLDRAARLAGMSPAELRRLNPGLRRAMTDPTGPHKLVLPIARARVFKARVAVLGGDREPSPLPVRERPAEPDRAASPQRLARAPGEAPALVHPRIHRVKQGETLKDIARAYDVTLPQLIAANKLRKRRALRSGQRLLIPVGGWKVQLGSSTI